MKNKILQHKENNIYVVGFVFNFIYNDDSLNMQWYNILCI